MWSVTAAEQYMHLRNNETFFSHNVSDTKITGELRRMARFADDIALTAEDGKYLEASSNNTSDLVRELCNMKINIAKQK